MGYLARPLSKTAKAEPGNILVVVEGVKFMDGDIVPLKDVHDLAEENDAKLAIDEATGTPGGTAKRRSAAVDRAVVITGASSGIGQASALHLDALGFRVFAGVRKQADADSLREKASERLTPIFIDVTNPESIAAAAQRVAQVTGKSGLAGLVNNAGVGTGGPLEFLPLAELRNQLEVNVIGQVAVVQAFLPLLRLGQGRVVNMSSISARVSLPFFGPYCASKFCLEALTDSLRGELRPWGIAVVSIQPGTISTAIWDKSIAKADELLAIFPQEAYRLYDSELSAARSALVLASGRGIKPEAVARTVGRALTAKRPKRRYLVGRDARLGALLAWLLPGSLRDRVISSI